MRKNLLGIAGATLTALALSGCGEDPGVEQGSVPFKGTSTESLNALSNQMKNKAQEQVKKADDEKADEARKPADEARKPADARPGAKRG